MTNKSIKNDRAQINGGWESSENMQLFSSLDNIKVITIKSVRNRKPAADHVYYWHKLEVVK